jgi:sensor histidine kinase YesM
MMKNSDLNDFWLRLIGIPVVGLLVPLIFFGRTFGTPVYWTSVWISIGYTAFYWQVCRYFFIWGNRRYPKLEDNFKRLAWIFGGVTVVLLFFCNSIHLCIEPLFIDSAKFPMPSILKINAASFTMFSTIAGIYESRRYFDLLQMALIEKEKLEKENLASQLEGLKNQVNPHFLFNSLNTLVHLIPENPETAVRFLQKLSKVYRYILEIRDTQLTPLSQELDFLQAYIFLLKERFGDNIAVKTHLEDLDTEGVHIVPLSLQILLENAIKHNVISAAKPLWIELNVEKENRRLVVKNNLQRKNQVQDSTGVGLENIKTRYSLVSHEKVDVIVSNSAFIVVLPLLKIENQSFL